MVVVRPEKGYKINIGRRLVWLGSDESQTGISQPRDSLAREKRPAHHERTAL